MNFEALPDYRCECMAATYRRHNGVKHQCHVRAAFRIVESGRMVCTIHKNMIQNKPKPVEFLEVK